MEIRKCSHHFVKIPIISELVSHFLLHQQHVLRGRGCVQNPIRMFVLMKAAGATVEGLVQTSWTISTVMVIDM